MSEQEEKDLLDFTAHLFLEEGHYTAMILKRNQWLWVLAALRKFNELYPDMPMDEVRQIWSGIENQPLLKIQEQLLELVKVAEQ